MADNVIKNILFTIFFTVGTCSVFFSILSEEILDYYQLSINQNKIKQLIDEMKVKDKKTAHLIEEIESNPDILKKLFPLKLGIDVNSPNAINVQLRNSELQGILQILEKNNNPDSQAEIPNWLKNTHQPAARSIVFLAGSGLILISLTCFSTKKSS